MIIKVNFKDNDFSEIFKSFFKDFYVNADKITYMEKENLQAYIDKYGEKPKKDNVLKLLEDVNSILDGEKPKITPEEEKQRKEDEYMVHNPKTCLEAFSAWRKVRELSCKDFKNLTPEELDSIKNYYMDGLFLFLKENCKDKTYNYLSDNLTFELVDRFEYTDNNGEIAVFLFNYNRLIIL